MLPVNLLDQLTAAPLGINEYVVVGSQSVLRAYPNAPDHDRPWSVVGCRWPVASSVCWPQCLLYKLDIMGNHAVVKGRRWRSTVAKSTGSTMGFLRETLPELSSDARGFIREHPDDARMAVAVALETAAAQSARRAGRTGQDVPERLGPFVVSGDGEQILGVTEAAARLEVSRTTVYGWAERNTLIAWRSTKRGLNIPAEQILGRGRVVPGLAEVVDIVGEPELAWAFLNQDWPFEEGVERPLERLSAGRVDEVISAAAGFGTTFT